MKPFLRTSSTIAVLSAAMAMAMPMANAAGQIRVNVDGNPVAFQGVDPIETNGSVLVPLRGVFEAMGAFVDYDSAQRTIFASKGDRKVTLPLGATSATVNGQPRDLSQPAQVIRGTTLVPLRFVAEALGSTVDWVEARNLVRIRTSGGPVAYTPTYDDNRPVASADTFSGIVRSVAADVGEITVRGQGQNKVIQVADSTNIWRKVSGMSAERVALADIMRGDDVTIRQDENGVATRITANYSVQQGTVRRVSTRADGRTVVILDNGRAVELSPNVMVHRNGEQVSLASVGPFDHVTIRTNPTSNVGYSVMVGQRINAHRRD